MARTGQKASSRGQAAATQGARTHTAREAGASATLSGSVARPVVVQLKKFLGRTHWQQSRVMTDALSLYTGISPIALQRMRELEATLGEVPVRAAITTAIERAIDHLDWEIVAQETARALAGRLPADVTEADLVAYTDEAVAASRADRRRRARQAAAPVAAG